MRRLTIFFAAICTLAWIFSGPAGADDHGKHQGGGGGGGSHQNAGGGGGAVPQGAGQQGAGKHGSGKHGSGGGSDNEGSDERGGGGRGRGGYGRGPIAPPYWGGERRRVPPGYGLPSVPGWFGYR